MFQNILIFKYEEEFTMKKKVHSSCAKQDKTNDEGKVIQIDPNTIQLSGRKGDIKLAIPYLGGDANDK
jgi:hypothetical protein